MRLRRKSGAVAPVRRILVGTDRSETATRGVRWAAEMAERYEAELIVTQAVRDGSERTAVERDLGEYAQDIAPDARILVRAGADPARQMAEIAREESVDVIVVGSVGMSGRKEFLLENIPNRISHLAPCTVVIVNTHQESGKR